MLILLLILLLIFCLQSNVDGPIHTRFQAFKSLFNSSVKNNPNKGAFLILLLIFGVRISGLVRSRFAFLCLSFFWRRDEVLAMRCCRGWEEGRGSAFLSATVAPLLFAMAHPILQAIFNKKGSFPPPFPRRMLIRWRFGLLGGHIIVRDH